MTKQGDHSTDERRSLAPTPLPDEAELYRRYEDFAARYFDGKLPPAHEVTIEWSNRLTSSAGRCSGPLKIIRLSTHYHRRFPEEIDVTLLHEMIHLLVPGHGPEFYRWMDHINARGGHVRRYAKERATPARHRWLYTCAGCGRKHPRRRRLPHGGRRHRCRGCNGKVRETRM